MTYRSLLGALSVLTAALPLAAQQDAVPCGQDVHTSIAPERAGLMAPGIDIPVPPQGARDPGHPDPRRVLPIGPDRGIPQPTTPPAAEAGTTGPTTGNFTFFTNRECRPTGANTSTTAAVEPSAAVCQDTVWQTGNWFAALSRDSGQTFDYVNPYTFFPAVDGGFCCDQRVEYVRSHDITVWYMQNAYSASTGVGSIRLAVAAGRDDLRSGVASSWKRWVFDPTRFGFPTNHWFDFPDVSYNDTYFYWTSNVFRHETNGSNTFVSALRVRIPLSQLQAGGTVSFSYFRGDVAGNGGGASWRLANGGDGSEMFWADYINTTTMRIWRQDAAGNNSFVDRGIASFTGGTASCVGPDGRDWMGNVMGRIRGSWGQSTEIGFIWTCNSQGGRPNPYLRVSRFRSSDRTLVAESDIWSSANCFGFAAAEANSLGHVGIVTAIGSATNYVHCSATIIDSYQGWTGGLTFYSLRSGVAGPTGNRFGDYFDVQRNWVDQRTFVGTGSAMTSSSTSTSHYAWFGRDDYAPTWVVLNVDATNAIRVPIALDVTDRNSLKDGNTSFTRTFTPRQGYTVTAPLTHTSGGTSYVFRRWAHKVSPSGAWQLQPIGQLDLTVDDIGTEDDTVEARYDAQRVLTIGSTNPTSGVAIAVSIDDLNGRRDGSTTFTRVYRDGDSVTLTAPATTGNNPFRRWRRGTQVSANLSVTLTVSADETVVAEYWNYTPGTFVSYGAGCPGTNNNVPAHRGSGTPETGQTIDYEVLLPNGSSFGSLAIGTRSAPIPLSTIGMGPRCTLDVYPVALSLPFSLNALGFGSLSVAVPNQASLIGGRLSTQATVADRGVSTPLPLVQSNAVETTIGGRR
ncbi:MAG: hypothetical protein R3F56_19825 [Planctomycetota bacterium]